MPYRRPLAGPIVFFGGAFIIEAILAVTCLVSFGTCVAVPATRHIELDDMITAFS